MEKRSKIMRYQMCYCDKHREIQVGSDLLIPFFIVATCMAVLVGVLSLISTADIYIRLTMGFVCALLAFGSPYMAYTGLKRTMLKWDHSEECSKKIARMACIRQTLGGRFKEMEESNNETSTK